MCDLGITYPDSLEPWFYHCYLSSRIYLSNYRKIFNYCKICSVSNGFGINNSLPINKQNAKRHIYIYLFCYVNLIPNKEHKYSINVKSPHPQHIFHQCTKLYLYKRYLMLYNLDTWINNHLTRKQLEFRTGLYMLLPNLTTNNRFSLI